MMELALKEFSQTRVLHKSWFKTSGELICNNVIFKLICAFDLIAVEVLGRNEQSTGHISCCTHNKWANLVFFSF